jgi:hypothetical protein
MGLIANAIIPEALCTPRTCLLLQAHYLYLPSLEADAVYTAIFGLVLIAQIDLGIRCRF